MKQPIDDGDQVLKSPIDHPNPSGVVAWRVDAENRVTPIGAPGWICPVCGRGLSPSTTECRCLDASKTATEESEDDGDSVWRPLVDWYESGAEEDDDGCGERRNSDSEIVELAIDDLKERDDVVLKNIALTNQLMNLKSEKQILEGRVEGFLEGALEHGSFAPLLSKVRGLATLLGFEDPPNSSDMERIIVEARHQIGTMRDEARTMRGTIRDHEAQIERFRRAEMVLNDRSYRDGEKIKALESEIEAKRGLIEKLKTDLHPDEIKHGVAELQDFLKRRRASPRP